MNLQADPVLDVGRIMTLGYQEFRVTPKKEGAVELLERLNAQGLS